MSFLLKLLFWVTLALSIYVVDYVSPRVLVLNHSFFEIFGIFLIFYGVMLNVIAGRTLRKFGHRRPTKHYSQPDQVVKEGIFSCMRHPAIFGLIFILIGISFMSAKLIVMLFGLFLSAVGEYFIMAVEERETLNRLGNDYCEFIKDKPPFSLSPYCLIDGIKKAFFN